MLTPERLEELRVEHEAWVSRGKSGFVSRGQFKDSSAIIELLNELQTSLVMTEAAIRIKDSIEIEMRHQAREFDNKIKSLFEKIKHGDEKHQLWLSQAIEDHFL